MKKITLLLLFSLSFVIFGQQYQPFSQNVSKRFQKLTNPQESDYFFHSLSETVNGDTLSFRQYHTSQPENYGVYVPSCPSWGGTSGLKLDTTWLGNLIHYNTFTKELMLTNESGTMLTFDFGISIGDSSLFYSDGSLNYYILNQGSSFSPIYSIMDSIKHFQIRPFDNSGNLYSSELEGFDIQLSKNNGIISFINCLEFPYIQEGFTLQGQTNPLIGNYQMTYDIAYPWNVGDIIQYKGIANYPIGMGKTYLTLQITGRTETTDSVRIDFVKTAVNSFPPQIPGFQPNFNSPIKFKKNTPIIEHPHNILIETNTKLNHFRESETQFCTDRSQLLSNEEFAYYCDSCGCCLGFDGNQTVNTNVVYTEGLGISDVIIVDYGFIVGGGTARTAFVIYSMVNGVECGDKWTSVDEYDPVEMIKLFPNPNKGTFSIEANSIIESCTVFSTVGKIMYSSSSLGSKTIDINLPEISPGVYLVRVDVSNSLSLFKQFVIE